MKFVPRNYQKRARRFLIDEKRAAFFVEAGLGKTATVLSAFVDLQAGLDARRMLVVAPLRVCESVWPDEIAQWDHTRHLTWARVEGSAIPLKRARSEVDKLLSLKGSGDHFMTKPSEKALAALEAQTDITLINFEVLPGVCGWMAKHGVPWDWIVFDESTKIKSHNSKRFKLLKPFLPRFKRRTILSGTPMPNSYLDLWAQIYCLDLGDSLSNYFTHFRDRYFTYNPWSYETKIKEGAAEQIEAKIKPYVLCLKAADWLEFPEIIDSRIVIDLPPKLRAQYNELEKEMFLKLRTIEVEAFNAATVTNKCRQFTAGALYATESKEWEAVHALKLDAVAEIVDQAQGDPTIICYEFKFELERLRKLYPRAPFKFDKETVAKWNAGKLPVVLSHPASMGHGLNLQTGPGRRMIWTALTWSEDLYSQTIARLCRPGQKRKVLTYRLIARDTVDLAVEDTLKRKASGQARLLDALNSYGKSRGFER